MTYDLTPKAARILDAPGEGDSPSAVAVRVVRACEEFVRHTSRLLGDLGVDMLFERSLRLANKRVPWLDVPKQASADQLRAELQAVLERREPEAIVAAFVAILSELVGLLERLIGPGLVARLLCEVWPNVFVPEAKDVP